jgi:large subunit ribosomal protein L25
MAKTSPTLKLELREKPGTIGSRKVRHEGRIPGVIYGHGEKPLAVSIEGRELGELLHGGRRQNIIDIQLDGKKDTAMVRDMQLDPVTRRVLSVDLQRISRSDIITAEVPIITIGIAAGVRDQGGMMDLVTHEIEVRGPADKIPQEIRVDVTELKIGEHISASELPLGEGIRLITPPDTSIVAIEVPRAEEAPTVVAATPEGAEGAAVPADAPAGEAAST